MIATWDDMLARGPSWLWLTHGMRNGDIYHVCGLAAAFKAAHGADTPIRLLMHPIQSPSLANLYADQFEEIAAVSLPDPLESWAPFPRVAGRGAFEMNAPIFLHSDLNPRTRHLTEFLAENRIPWMALYRHALGLADDAEFMPPSLNASNVALARTLCDDSGVVPGRTAVLFPYAQSFAVASLGHFAALAQRLSDAGWAVFTSVAGPEEPVAGTRPISIPFAILPDVVERAGWGIAVRSGICDIVAPTRARKTFVFRSRKELAQWGVASMGLCRDAHEISFDFGLQTPDAFCAAVMAGSEIQPALPGVRRLSDRMDQSGVASVSFVEAQRRVASGDAGSPGWTGGSGGLRVLDLPSRADPRWGELLTDVLEGLDRDHPDLAWSACRDHAGPDAFEEIEREALRRGTYAAAGFQHTVLGLEAGSLAARLPPWTRDSVIAAEPMTADKVVLCEARARPEGLAFADGMRPLSFGGVQLLLGWALLEVWGIWSCGGRCMLKVTLDDPVDDGFALRLEVIAALSEAFPVLAMTIGINGTPCGRASVRLHEPGVLDIAVPAEVARSARTFFIELAFDHILSPTEQGLGEDGRALGIGLRSVELLRDVN